MPFIPHTPEFLVSRSDSKNPATTCKGIRLDGKPCRRDLAANPRVSPNSKRGAQDGILAVLRADDEHESSAAAFFCWQHKDQATGLVAKDQNNRQGELYPLKERTSTDTLIERLGILDVDGDQKGRERKGQKVYQTTRAARKETLPKKWQDVPGPLLAVSNSEKLHDKDYGQRHQRRPHPLLSLLCCAGNLDQDLPQPSQIRPSRSPNTHSTVTSLPKQVGAMPKKSDVSPHRTDFGKQRSPILSSSRLPLTNKSTNSNTRPSLPRHPSSQTQNLLALIPKSLSPQTTSQLLAELAKPVSEHDEGGYIYMFWLVPTTRPLPSSATASSLLGASPSSNHHGRNSGSILHNGRQDPSLSSPKSTILLKIGRASNVQRRMNEWTRQCGYNLSLIRYYPYIPSSPQPSPSRPGLSSANQNPHQVPHSHRVERLIHIELAERRVKKTCDTCGKEHREWFEVNGDREGVKGVDGVIRRWVEWAEGSLRRKEYATD
ncbi:MAG: hypothetical protein LQ342_000590 [Letrouitia transgressa]|nr:MAG: hypothetical protein LQ342_000590 [Letrouitia transgressa]